jgi:hypothetical protein
MVSSDESANFALLEHFIDRRQNSDRSAPLQPFGHEGGVLPVPDALFHLDPLAPNFDDADDLPPEKWTPGYAAFASACSGVMYPIAECRRSRL